jgi:hypothetical protein
LKYKVRVHVLLETPGISGKLLPPCTRPYNEVSLYENGKIRIKNGIVSEIMNIRRISPLKKTPMKYDLWKN